MQCAACCLCRPWPCGYTGMDSIQWWDAIASLQMGLGGGFSMAPAKLN